MTDAQCPTPMRTDAPVAAAAAIRAYAPASLSPAAAAFARAAAARAAPQTRERAKALLYAAGRLAAFGESVGMELCAEALLAEATIERFVAHGLRGGLGGDAAHAEDQPAGAGPRPSGRSAARPGAAAPRARQGPLLRRRRSTATCASRRPAHRGAADARHGARLPGGRGGPRRGRAAPPARARREAALGRARGRGLGTQGAGGAGARRASRRPWRRPPASPGGATCSAGGSPAGATSATRWGRRSAPTPRCRAWRPGGCGRPGFASARSRSGLRAFMEAAGMRCSQRLGDLVAELPEVDERAAVALLGGAGGGQGEA